MNRSAFLGVTLIAVVMTPASCPAAEPLRMKFSPGETLRFQISQQAVTTLETPGEPTTTVTGQVVDFVWIVESVQPSGDAKIRQDILRARITVTGPGGAGYDFDTQTEEPPVGLAALIAPLFEALSEHDYSFTLTPRSELRDLEVPEELLAALQNVPGMALAGSKKEMLKQMVRPSLIPLPEGPLEEDQTWSARVEIPMPVIGKQVVETSYQYRGAREVDGRLLEVIAPKTQIVSEESGAAPVTVHLQVIDSQGEVLFDRVRGRIVSADISQKISVKVVADEQKTTGMIEQTTKLVSLAEEPNDTDAAGP